MLPTYISQCKCDNFATLTGIVADPLRHGLSRLRLDAGETPIESGFLKAFILEKSCIWN